MGNFVPASFLNDYMGPLIDLYQPKLVGFRDVRDRRWLWLRKKVVPVYEWPNITIRSTAYNTGTRPDGEE